MTITQFSIAIKALAGSENTLKVNMFLSCGRVVSVRNGQSLIAKDGLVWVGTAETGDLSIIDLVKIEALTMTSTPDDPKSTLQ